MVSENRYLFNVSVFVIILLVGQGLNAQNNMMKEETKMVTIADVNEPNGVIHCIIT
ncbi:hypothetical protein QLS71_014225 [Mariniflexile litorale]|uniref:Uncharacterized protein n=1 Tax=Mariniflexile litorale TaxID=3045158 RepID=A0AAU7EDH3_9FLAO|nr:hypothetical protein [Mariniflexile sp. KMM 9835]MDQ8212919.1 hypothetical protein [Mariniflexile sp. KMM 9835]